MYKRRIMGVLILVIFVFFAACKQDQTSSNSTTNNNPTAPKATPDQFAAARTVFDKDCKSCHGQNGDGGPVKLADGTRLKVPSLREGHALRHADSEFVKQITKGGDGMPAFADKLKPEEINDLIKFIRHEFQGGMMPPAEMKSPMKDMKMK